MGLQYILLATKVAEFRVHPVAISFGIRGEVSFESVRAVHVELIVGGLNLRACVGTAADQDDRRLPDCPRTVRRNLSEIVMLIVVDADANYESVRIVDIRPVILLPSTLGYP